ncbi:hypothetical protein [Paraburkholderia caribensis]|uniref:hypothetical protein n=1 Tax=Paraburkholderia caribensis TaxID=75105 RepID=UPI00078BAF83|nr:hypothetical protein [Paraburkholderia caribensis]AMV41774.1 hypothetical protein ATN79_03625 [Paraburkholderia caribensis]
MADRVSFSNEEQTLDDIAIYYLDVQAGLFEFFSGDSQTLLQRYSGEKIDEAQERALAELDMTSSLSVLSSIEAAIRLDYLRRVYGRWRDPLSKAMKLLHQEKENNARLEDDLIRLWREETDLSKVLLGELVGAFRYRHWLAHGRYWKPKLGRKYDYQSVFEIAQEFSAAMGEYCQTSQAQ